MAESRETKREEGTLSEYLWSQLGNTVDEDDAAFLAALMATDRRVQIV